MQKFKSIVRHWLPIATVVTALCGLVYLTVQQSLRQSANDPQIQMAEDVAQALATGARPESLIPETQVDVARSLAPFMMFFNDHGEVIASSGQLHGAPPALPAGVLETVRLQGQDRVTWQPEPGVRIAAVVERAESPSPGFVLAGRSLREVEKREDQVFSLTSLAWLVTLAASLVVVTGCELLL